MKTKELNEFFKEKNIKVICRFYKRDEMGEVILDENRTPIHDTVQLTTNYLSVDHGWYELIHNLINELIETNWDLKIRQVKEKFGGLRFYIGATTDKQFEIIRKYEELSYETCEVCGEKGELRDDCGSNNSRWYKTMCDKHYNELKKNK